MKQSCKTCKWAKWQRTLKGRIASKRAGKCDYPEVAALAMPLLPGCTQLVISRLNDRLGIWPDDGESCGCYAVAEQKGQKPCA